MKRAVFIFLWLSYSILSFAQTEGETTPLHFPKDTTVIAEPTIRDLPVLSTDYIPSLCFSNNLYSGYYATYFTPNMNFGTPFSHPLPRWIAFSADNQDYPGMMATESGSVRVSSQNAAFRYNAYAGAVKYATFSALETSYFIGGEASYRFNPNLSLTIFGTYYSNNPYFGMAAYPYVQTTNYGGYVTISPNSIFSLSVGTNSHYDPFARRMVVTPIVMPSVDLGFSRLEIDLGYLLKDFIYSWAKSRRR